MAPLPLSHYQVALREALAHDAAPTDAQPRLGTVLFQLFTSGHPIHRRQALIRKATLNLIQTAPGYPGLLALIHHLAPAHRAVVGDALQRLVHHPQHQALALKGLQQVLTPERLTILVRQVRQRPEQRAVLLHLIPRLSAELRLTFEDLKQDPQLGLTARMLADQLTLQRTVAPASAPTGRRLRL